MATVTDLSDWAKYRIVRNAPQDLPPLELQVDEDDFRYCLCGHSKSSHDASESYCYACELNDEDDELDPRHPYTDEHPE